MGCKQGGPVGRKGIYSAKIFLMLDHISVISFVYYFNQLHQKNYKLTFLTASVLV